MDVVKCKFGENPNCRLICADIHDVMKLLNIMSDTVNESIEILEKNHLIQFQNGEDFNYSDLFDKVYRRYLQLEELRNEIRFSYDDTLGQINSLSEKLALSENKVLKLQNELKNLKNDTKNESKNG